MSSFATIWGPGRGTVTIRYTFTVDPDEDASVVNVGDENDAILDFYIPKGDPGDPGDQGLSGTVDIDITTTLPPGSAATVVNTGTPEAAILSFGIPEGEKGEKGDDGEPSPLPAFSTKTIQRFTVPTNLAVAATFIDVTAFTFEAANEIDFYRNGVIQHDFDVPSTARITLPDPAKSGEILDVVQRTGAAGDTQQIFINDPPAVAYPALGFVPLVGFPDVYEMVINVP